MVKINYAVLEFDHIVEFAKDRTVFAAARENGNGHLRIFLVNEETGNVYTRNGRADSWEELQGSDHDTIVSRINLARNNHIPVYRVNGDSGAHN